jgi:predicted DNA-binding protein
MAPYNHRGREPRPNRLEIRLSDSELEMLNQACIELDRTGSAIVRLALERFLGEVQDEATRVSNSEEPTGHR